MIILVMLALLAVAAFLIYLMVIGLAGLITAAREIRAGVKQGLSKDAVRSARTQRIYAENARLKAERAARKASKKEKR